MVARRMGYRPNPMLGALMTQIRSRKPLSTANLACLHGEPRSSDTFQTESEFLKGLGTAAAQLGYSIDFFDSARSRLTPVDLGRIWKARNVRGVVLSNIRASPSMEFPWQNFAWVVNGRITGLPEFHRVGNAIYEVVKTALHEVFRRGYRRPSLAVRLKGETRAGFRWPAAFIGNLLRFGFEASMDQVFQGEWTESHFRKWFKREQPDVILAFVDQPRLWLEQMNVSVPKQVGFIHLAANISEHNVSGVVQDFRRVGEAAIHALDSQLRRNELGIPTAPITLTVPGVWREGITLRRL